MIEHVTNLETVKLLKTFCKLNPKFALNADLAIVDLSYKVMFWFRYYDDPEGIKFICKVPHNTMFKDKLVKKRPFKSNGQTNFIISS